MSSGKMTMEKPHLRNVAIVVTVGGVIPLIHTGGDVVNALVSAFGAAVGALIFLVMWRAWRKHQGKSTY